MDLPRTLPFLEIWEEGNINYLEAFPVQPCVLGARRPTPYEGGDSHIGGCPGWLQGNDYRNFQSPSVPSGEKRSAEYCAPFQAPR